MNIHTTTDLMDIRRADQAYLAALVTSAACCRRFVRRVCSSWQLDEERIDIGALLVSELATNAVQASAAIQTLSGHEPTCVEGQLIGVRLLELVNSLVIEVWDTSPKPPVLIQPAEALEHGRGLQLVDALSIRWGYYDAHMGGKVVWSQLALTTDAHERDPDDAEGFRVLETLEGNPWDDYA
jgi:anti-sigma regulatory factor (Ser/Thr protein kinase)